MNNFKVITGGRRSSPKIKGHLKLVTDNFVDSFEKIKSFDNNFLKCLELHETWCDILSRLTKRQRDQCDLGSIDYRSNACKVLNLSDNPKIKARCYELLILADKYEHFKNNEGAIK